MSLHTLLSDISRCTTCSAHLPHGIRPVLAAHAESKVAIIGQAPGSVVHRTGVPWDDKSGQRLRHWLGVTDDAFYNPQNFALLPMGFCYPGKGKSGDLPPRPECAPQWHEPLLGELHDLQLILLVGSYAQNYYLRAAARPTLTETVRDFQTYLPRYLPLPHPSPRNNIWLKRNAWFEADLLPTLRREVQQLLA
ncbi:uracil-DNA glycosylase family protein [Marinoscillum furvescens]|uniref:Uracil-DNA glycosylase n=1 Tax=Marinoscillum furvescens DSM 4134 TaxID=1122208 RepID=A0A3D9KVZ0_MARFU|nr:uracil-DNA glycosylase family protein [Marinoscillum furvescens]RED92013.1 uracil-DNA glycosylase [Marinoscillum furvescens DSM 4134]